jgi:UDP-3-O-[3-hydroxymyristoyl] glucosamine N-acyltransferase
LPDPISKITGVKQIGDKVQVGEHCSVNAKLSFQTSVPKNKTSNKETRPI